MIESNSLKVYSNNVTEWIIAYSSEDAIKVWEETVGEKYNIDDFGEFSPEDDDYEISFFNEDNNILIPTGAKKISEMTYRAKCKEWVETLGRSFFCSTEY